MIKDFSQALIDANLISEEKLKKITGSRLGNNSIVYKLLYTESLKEEDFLNFYQQFTGIKRISLKNINLDEALLTAIEPDILRRFFCFPLKKTELLLTIAMVDPLDYQAIDILERTSGCQINPVLAAYSEISELIDKEYGITDSVKNIVKELETSDVLPVTISSENEIFNTSAKSGPINKMLHLIISHAIREKASDIHFEQSGQELQCKFRVDGVLYKFLSFPRQLANSVISTIKILAKMDIAEKRLPLDGSFQVKIDSKVIDIRVSSFPTIAGEKIALRLLDKESYLFELDALGLSDKMKQLFKPLINQKNGFILVTGPTGSGKTTTLYAALEHIKSIEKNIMTIEDPVEYRLEMINQAQVNLKSGLTFARGLRSFLRQDPDIILVGEIRDKETAEIAFQAALTGHLVLSTLHTNDAPSTITRLHDMGIEKYLLSSSILNGILAQRLARKNCPHCLTAYQPDKKMMDWLNLAENSQTFYKGAGCEKCRGKGYSGRVALFELLIPDENINSLIRSSNFSSENIRKETPAENLISFKEDAAFKIAKNITTVEEAYRILR